MIVGRIRRVLATGGSLPCRTMRSRPARGRARHRPRRGLIAAFALVWSGPWTRPEANETLRRTLPLVIGFLPAVCWEQRAGSCRSVDVESARASFVGRDLPASIAVRPRFQISWGQR